MENTNEYFVNQVGAKIPLNSTKSYETYIEESGTLEFFLLYILMAEHSDKDDFKNDLIDHFKQDKNIISKKLIGFLQSDKGDDIFNVNTYELYFGQMAYTRLTDNALSYFKDVLSEVVIKNSNILKSSEKESLDYIISFDTMEDLINDLTEKKIKKLFYGSIIDIKNFFRKRLGIELFSDENDENNFNQLTKQRNLIVHNRGVITQELADEFPIYEELIGNKLHFTFEQLSTINKIINNIIVEIDIKLRKKFDLNTIPM